MKRGTARLFLLFCSGDLPSLRPVLPAMANHSENQTSVPDNMVPKPDSARTYSPAPQSVLHLPVRVPLADSNILSTSHRAKLSVPGTPSGLQQHKLQNTTGYHNVVFAGKKAQAARVEELVKEKAFIPEQLVHNVCIFACFSLLMSTHVRR
jgi:hypothetical protein